MRPLLTALERLKLCLRAAPTREAATRLFDEFVAAGASDADLELQAFISAGLFMNSTRSGHEEPPRARDFAIGIGDRRPSRRATTDDRAQPPRAPKSGL
jgi:hypothetical protein